MPSGFFLLLRFFLRVDDVLIRINDRRFHYEVENNFILKEFTSKEATVQKLQHVSWWLRPMHDANISFDSVCRFRQPCSLHLVKSKSIYQYWSKQRTEIWFQNDEKPMNKQSRHCLCGILFLVNHFFIAIIRKKSRHSTHSLFLLLPISKSEKVCSSSLLLNCNDFRVFYLFFSKSLENDS